MPTRVVVACSNAMGGPDFFFVEVEATQKQIEQGKHYTAAEIQAGSEGYESPYVCFDEIDGPSGLFGLFEWDTASVIPGNIKKLCNLT